MAGAVPAGVSSLRVDVPPDVVVEHVVTGLREGHVEVEHRLSSGAQLADSSLSGWLVSLVVPVWSIIKPRSCACIEAVCPGVAHAFDHSKLLGCSCEIMLLTFAPLVEYLLLVCVLVSLVERKSKSSGVAMVSSLRVDVLASL